MKQNKKYIVLFTILFLLTVSFSCKNNKSASKEKTDNPSNTSGIKAQSSKITLEKLENSPAYSDAILQLENSKDLENLKNNTIDFNFKVSNYVLGDQTKSINTEKLANSGKGQHIHFILDNKPYSAHYEPTFTKEIPEGEHHLVAFLSRSYHESVKNEQSVIVKKLVVGKNSKDAEQLNIDIEAPTLIYSRPKGNYSSKDAENILLDFFVLNTKLSQNGHKIKATINGTVFIITEWASHVIKGLPKGEVTIILELIDKNGQLISGPFNKVKRTITLTK